MADITITEIDDVIHFIESAQNKYGITNCFELHTAKVMLQIMQMKLRNKSIQNKNSNVIKDEKDDNKDAAIMFN